MVDNTQVAAFADELLAHADPQRANFVVVSADSSKSLRFHGFCTKYPDRIVEVGIAENCAIATAFGISYSGLKVFVTGYAAFLLFRGLESIRSYVAYHNADVTILGGMAGLSASHDGFMHQAVEDIGLLRAVEKLEILVPSDEQTARAAARTCLMQPGPRYVRLARREVCLPSPVHEAWPFCWRRAEGHDVLLCAYGPILERCVSAANLLAERGIRSSILEVGRILPFPYQQFRDATQAFSRIVVVEDHLSSTGLASMIAELLRNSDQVVVRVGLEAGVMVSGEYHEALDHAGLSIENIVAAATADVVLA